MSATNQGTLGFGVQLLMGGPASGSNGGAYTNIARIDDFTAPKQKVASASVDAHDNPTNAAGLPINDFIPGWIDRGSMGVKMFHTKAQYATLSNNVGIPNYWKVILPDSSGFICTGFIEELGDQVPKEQAMQSEMSIKLSGLVLPTFNVTQT